jgi:hypothetical protein
MRLAWRSGQQEETDDDAGPIDGGDAMQRHATALFADRHAAHAAVEQLVQAGFPRDAISLVMTEDTHEREFGPLGGEKSGVRARRHAGVLGAITSGLVALACPSGTALRAAGPIVAALMRAGPATFAVSSALVSSGFGEPEARFVDEGVRAGSIVVGVHASGERMRLALQLLELSGGAAPQAA